MPCDCEVVVGQGVAEGVTVLPTDEILTILTNSVGLNVETLMSVEGLARAMSGDRVFLDMADGRSIPVQVIAGKDISKRGKVLKVDPARQRVVVERVNMIQRHLRPSRTMRQGGIIVTNAESVIFEWLTDAAHARFKAVSKLLK